MKLISVEVEELPDRVIVRGDDEQVIRQTHNDAMQAMGEKLFAKHGEPCFLDETGIPPETFAEIDREVQKMQKKLNRRAKILRFFNAKRGGWLERLVMPGKPVKRDQDK